VAQPSTTYAPGDPTATVLYVIVRQHFETFRTQAASLRDGDGLPKFVEREFRDFLRCGCLAGGFTFGAPSTGSIDSSPSRAKGAASARAAAAHGGAGRASGRSRLARRAGTPMGLEPPASLAVPAGMGS
jgi:hypothetical protein